MLPLSDEEMIAAARLHGHSPGAAPLYPDGKRPIQHGTGGNGLNRWGHAGSTADPNRGYGPRQRFAGVDVDFEYLPGYLSGAYAAFLERRGAFCGP